jgi:hypothetical protein
MRRSAPVLMSLLGSTFRVTFTKSLFKISKFEGDFGCCGVLYRVFGFKLFRDGKKDGMEFFAPRTAK